MAEEIGRMFQRQTAYLRGALGRRTLDWAHQPEPYKVYANVPQITLPAPERDQGPGLWNILQQRRSQRKFLPEAITLAQLSQLVWACQGVTGRAGVHLFRAAPSAGALYPVETYLLIQRVTEIEPGIYHYMVPSHSLAQLKTGDWGEAFAAAALDQGMVAQAAVTFIWTAVFERCEWKYRQRAWRYVYLDAGHIAENLALAAVALNLGSCQIAALYDDEVNGLLDLDGNTESVLYLTAVGKI